MHIDFHLHNDILVACPALERLDASIAREFRDRVLKQLGQGRRLVIDLASVKFVDSSGIGALVSLLKALGENARLPLVSDVKGVGMLIEMTRLDTLMPVCASLDDALAA
jgi:anti-sigma B factor antagonist